MITFSPVKTNYSSINTFKSKKTEQTKNTNNQHKNNSNISKVKTGAMVTTALLAGLGIGTCMPSSSSTLENTTNIRTEEVIKDKDNDKGNNKNKTNILSYEEFQQELNSPKKVYILRDTIKNKDGSVKIKEAHYTINNDAALTAEIVRDLNTGDTVATANYSDFLFVPKKEVINDYANKIKQEKYIKDFDYETGTAKSTNKITYYNDGSKNITNISNPEFRIETKFVESPKTIKEREEKQARQKKQEQAELDEIGEALFREFMMMN